MKMLLLAGSALALLGAPVAQAAVSTYSVMTTWAEPETAPNDSIFIGSFDFDSTTKTVSNLKGVLSESMTGNGVGYPNDSMTWLTLGNQLVSWYDGTLGGTFAATFKNSTTTTFTKSFGGDTWLPGGEVVYAGFPNAAANPGNAYALIFVPDNPLAQLTQAQVDKLAYADCATGGMMGATCMTGTSIAGYGTLGTMGGFPLSQTIAAVPEPDTYAMFMAGLGLMGFISRRRGSKRFKLFG
ncbi:MAG: PEP-CTERM sorting domain-containing protein [Azonexaceae bacterium]|nr:PEP-CTERM sorting domain-containing protein [Azonexaceae bacterium]